MKRSQFPKVFSFKELHLNLNLLPFPVKKIVALYCKTLESKISDVRCKFLPLDVDTVNKQNLWVKVWVLWQGMMECLYLASISCEFDLNKKYFLICNMYHLMRNEEKVERKYQFPGFFEEWRTLILFLAFSINDCQVDVFGINHNLKACWTDYQ